MAITEYTKTIYHYVCEVQENGGKYPSTIVYEVCYTNEDFDDKNEAFSCGWIVREDGKVYCPGCSKFEVWKNSE